VCSFVGAVRPLLLISIDLRPATTETNAIRFRIFEIQSGAYKDDKIAGARIIACRNTLGVWCLEESAVPPYSGKVAIGVRLRDSATHHDANTHTPYLNNDDTKIWI
jgi:hypothetical protein